MGLGAISCTPLDMVISADFGSSSSKTAANKTMEGSSRQSLVVLLAALASPGFLALPALKKQQAWQPLTDSGYCCMFHVAAQYLDTLNPFKQCLSKSTAYDSNPALYPERSTHRNDAQQSSET